MFDVAVVGKGLFGAAAVRHLARSGLSSVMIGPDEPSSGAAHSGPYGAHYDEARILVARGNDAEVALTRLAIEGMIQLESSVGYPLIVRSGALEIVPSQSTGASLVDGVVSVPDGSQRRDEPPPQGYFNPRRYIAAALTEATTNGAAVITETVDHVDESAAGFAVATAAARVVEARRLVIAAGAWSNQLLRRRLAVRLKTESVIFARLEDDRATAMTMRPTVFHGDVAGVESIYALPPLQHRDGNWYLKLGANTLVDVAVSDHEINGWYSQGDAAAAEPHLREAFATVFPGIEPLGFHTERCVITYSQHGRPYIGALDRPGLFVATAGNGHGASWADGVGSLVARRIRGEPWDGFRSGSFEPIYQDEARPWPRPLLLAERRAG